LEIQAAGPDRLAAFFVGLSPHLNIRLAQANHQYKPLDEATRRREATATWGYSLVNTPARSRQEISQGVQNAT
jgi:hypothetical protein